MTVGDFVAFVAAVANAFIACSSGNLQGWGRAGAAILQGASIG